MTTLDSPLEEHEKTEEPAPPRAHGVRMSTLYIVAFAITGASLGLRRMRDNSFMWHVRTGHYILEHGIPRGDPYSFTAPGVKWVAQSWLAELAYGVVDQLGHGFGLRLFTAVVSAAIGALVFIMALRCSGDRLRALGLSALALGVLEQIWSGRPLLLGLLAMLVIVYICEIPDAAISRHAEISIPIVMWLWVNVHGTFALGFAYLAFHLVGRALDGARVNEGPERKILFGTAIASVAAFINPYGFDLVLFPIHLMGRSAILATVQEWQSPNFRELGGQLFAAWIVLGIVLLARKGCSRRDLLVGMLFLVLGLWAVRNVGLAVVVLLPIMARASARRGPDGTPITEPRTDERRPANTLMLALLFLIMTAFVVHAHSEPSWDLQSYPVTSLQYLHDNGLLGHRLLTTDAWGGFVIATQYPTQKVFFDDRYDTYPVAINNAYDALLRLEPGWQKQLQKYDIDVIVWPTQAPLVQALQLDKNWTQVHADKVAVVYVRRPTGSS